MDPKPSEHWHCSHWKNAESPRPQSRSVSPEELAKPTAAAWMTMAKTQRYTGCCLVTDAWKNIEPSMGDGHRLWRSVLHVTKANWQMHVRFS